VSQPLPRNQTANLDNGKRFTGWFGEGGEVLPALLPTQGRRLQGAETTDRCLGQPTCLDPR
jgi:hypothetical protein